MDNEIKIESGIPIPERGRNYSDYPFERLEIGESFLFPEGTKRSTAGTSATYQGMKLKRKFVTRQTSKGIRCWRIA
jgi:hypothetical protein